MFTMLILLLAGLGAAALAGIIIHCAYLAARWLFGRIRDFLSQRVGNTVFLCEVGDIVMGLRGEAQKNGNIADINDVLAQLDGKDGILEGYFDQNGKMVNVDIVTTDQMDPQITNFVNKYPNKQAILVDGGGN